MKSSSRFINRELSWLEFNRRVLHEARRRDVPLLERLKFLAIVASNFDEFFMVRVASVKRQVAGGDYVTCPSGVAPSALLEQTRATSTEIVDEAYRLLSEEVLPGLKQAGLVWRRSQDLTSSHRSFLQKLFQEEIFPVLTPIRVTEGADLPYVTNLRLHVGFVLEPVEESQLTVSDETGPTLAIVQVPSSLNRVIFLPDDAGTVSYVLLEDVIVTHAASLFPGYTIREHCHFRVTRDADMGVDEERDEDFVEAMEQLLEHRDFSEAVRLTISPSSEDLRDRLCALVDIRSDDLFSVDGPLRLADFFAVAGINGFDDHKYPRWQSYDSPAVPQDEPLWETIRRRDIMLFHPYESFDPVIRLVRDAAVDSQVLAIKMTLYRTSGDSPIVKALEAAAQRGVQVTVLVELKARFDEERNITWADRLERAGVIVVYGIARLKVHAKALLIVRREREGIRRYVHLGTGNYNDKTAKLYTDIGLMSARTDLAYEAGLFFNAITGYSAIPALNRLVMAPVALKPRLLQLIEREALRSKSGVESRIMAKLNSLADPDVIEALYAASSAGVEIKLNIRGICMLVAGVKGMSERISVTSVIDRYLEHARVIYFHNGGAPEVFAASADWMPRNLERRVELMFPLEAEDVKKRAITALEMAFADTTNSHLMQPDGTYAPPDPGKGTPLRSQQWFHDRAKERGDELDATDQKVFDVRRKPPKA